MNTEKIVNTKSLGVQDLLLSALIQQRVSVSIYLVNGIKLQGEIVSFDQFVLVLRGLTSQMLFKHAISTIVPSRDVEWKKRTQDVEPELAAKPKVELSAAPVSETELPSQEPIAVAPVVANDVPRPKLARKKKLP